MTCARCGRLIAQVDTNVWYHIHERYLRTDGTDDFARDDLEYSHTDGSPVTP